MYISMVLATVILIGLITIFRRLSKYNALNKLKGPTSLELLKFMSNASHADIYRYLMDLSKKYGSVVRLWIKPLRPAILVTDPKFFEQILTRREHFHKTDAYRLFSPIVGDGLATIQNVEVWKEDRKLVATCFNHKSIAQYPIVLQEHINKLISTLKTRNNQTTDVQPLIQRYTLGVIFELLTRENITRNEDGVEKFLVSIKSFLAVYLERAFSSFKFNDFLFSFCKSYEIYRDTGKYVHDDINNIVKSQISLRNCNNDPKQAIDFLGILLESGLEYDRLLSQMKTFLLAGSDTTGQAISFALYELSKRPDIQQKIYDEYTTVLGAETNRIASFEDIQQLKYTETVVKEILRIYPSFPIIQRKLTTPVSIGGTTIPSDTDVIFSIMGLQTSPSLYENPEEFDPDRFSADNISKIPSGAYVPFSLGPRDCLGQKLPWFK